MRMHGIGGIGKIAEGGISENAGMWKCRIVE
jgi:hypothetical protein